MLVQRQALATEVEGILDAHPLAARILLEIGDASAISAHLAADAGIAPVTRRSGTSIRGEHPARSGNRKLKRAFFLAAFAALSDPTSRGLLPAQTRRRQETQRRAHLPGLTTLRRPLRMLRNKTYYRHPETHGA